MSQQVEVSVFSGDRLVDGPLVRPVRLTPTGRAGVVYGGEVYPLHRGDRIDLAEPSFDKATCATFVVGGAPIPYAVTAPPRAAAMPAQLVAEDDWYVESNRFGHYLVFDADERTAGQVVDLVDDAGLVVRRWDSSHRVADNGRRYDWFVRLGFQGDRDTCVQILRGLLRGPAVSPITVALPDGLQSSVVAALEKALVVAQENTRLVDEVERLRSALALSAGQIEVVQLEAEAAAAAAAATADVLDSRVAALVEDLAQARDSHTRQVEALRGELAEAHLRNDQDQTAAIAAERDRAFDEWAASDVRLVEVTRALGEKNREVLVLRARADQAEAHLAEVKDAERERRTAARETGPVSRVPRDNAAAFVRDLVRRCRLDDDSVELLLQLERSDKMMRELIRIDDRSDDLRVRAKKVQGYDRWFEIAGVPIGERKAMGRIYYRAGPDDEVEVHLHHKDDGPEQRRFMEKKLR